MQILVKTKGRKKHRAMIHVYDAETDSALCRSWPKPGEQYGPGSVWELQEVDDFKEVHYEQRCWHCSKKLIAKKAPPALPKPPSARERRQQRDRDRLAAWNAQAI